MDEQRIQAYLALIQELLACPGGEENQVLNRHSELIDEGFVQMCGVVAEQMRGEGGEDEAGFLLQVAQQVAEYLQNAEKPRRGATLAPETASESCDGTQPNATPEEYFRFLMQVLQAIVESKNNPQVVYPILAQHQDKLDLVFAEILKRWFEAELDPDDSEKNQALAAILNSFAVDIQEFPLGSRANNIEIAIAAYEKALQIRTREAFPQDWAMTQNNLGNAYSDRITGERAENLDRAIASYNNALQIRTREAFPQDWATTQNNLGTAYNNRITGERAENLDRAIRIYQEALEVCTRTAFPQNHTETLNNLGFTYQDQSRHYTADPEKKQTALHNAYNTFEQALDTVEFLRGEIVSGDEAKRKLNEEWNRLYRGMVEVCLELGNHNTAIEYVDRSKARNLVELIAIRDAYPECEIPSKVRQRLQDLRQAIDEEERRLNQDPNPNYTHITQLRQEFQNKFPYKPVTFDQIQGLLDEETAILEWYILGDKFLTFTLTSQTLNLWTSSEDDLEQLGNWAVEYLTAYYQSKEPLQKASDALKEAKTDEETKEAQRLLKEAQEIWQNPLAERLEILAQILHLDEILHNLFENFPSCKKLILIPHRYLHLFPLHALPIVISVGADGIRPVPPRNKTPEDASIAPLQELFGNGVAYAPNCQLLQQAQNRSRPDFKSLFAIQNPKENLAFADLEVETISNIFPKPTILERKKAKKSALLSSREDLTQTNHLYFSCHAAFNNTSPLDSGLELADGILTLEDIISSLNLSRCSLVTLSACETGQVAIDTTDEYISLASGFILAGSPSVIVTQWSVNQVSTALLLMKTYETLQQNPGKLTIALKTAQIWLRDTTVEGFKEWVQQSPLLTNSWRKTLQTFFNNMADNKDRKPYQSPYHWAAFCVVGKGEQKMASDADKIQAFVSLIEENTDKLVAEHGQSLSELRNQLGDDDEKNVEVIEKWLQDTDNQLYQTYSQTLDSINPLLGATGEKGFGGSKATPKKTSKSLQEIIGNITKRNTNPPPSPEQKSNPPS
ncbi:CHAT domain-containing protein [Lusitaniella coriacea LEGE 07157]|uniref:CHAT domain-containing protein n=1 Tax=Lusitaniella coriacea LEGE 07157 TaxID=945747 RepID=A0A8J7DY26_9CYAN|nr:CHAT domain-containing tetratricopeptide repeat protein [Lusitaniella coriacea]MBE9117466.1 CHAT domain-containing protein [Lusitaniella coriacea LEGE 07157]